MESEYMTRKGFAKLVAKRADLHQKLKDAGQRAGEAAGVNSDWHDNPAYEQSIIDMNVLARQIMEIDVQLRNAKIIDEQDREAEVVDVGNSVTVEIDGEIVTYFIGGGADSDPARGTISHKAPLARGLMGKRAGEETVVKTPGSSVKVKILRVGKGDVHLG